MALKKKRPKNKRRTLITKLDNIFSKYIRLKYSDPKGMCLCVSCDAEKHRKEMHNAHFISRGHFSTRRDEENCRPACPSCNSFRPELHMRQFTVYQMDRLGRDGFDELILKGNEPRNWKIRELEEMIEFYKVSVEALLRNFPHKEK